MFASSWILFNDLAFVNRIPIASIVVCLLHKSIREESDYVMPDYREYRHYSHALRKVFYLGLIPRLEGKLPLGELENKVRSAALGLFHLQGEVSLLDPGEERGEGTPESLFSPRPLGGHLIPRIWKRTSLSLSLSSKLSTITCCQTPMKSSPSVTGMVRLVP